MQLELTASISSELHWLSFTDNMCEALKLKLNLLNCSAIQKQENNMVRMTNETYYLPSKSENEEMSKYKPRKFWVVVFLGQKHS